MANGDTLTPEEEKRANEIGAAVGGAVDNFTSGQPTPEQEQQAALQGIPILEFLSQQVQTPTLPVGAEFKPVLQELQPEEVQAQITTPTVTPVAAPTIAPAPVITAAQGQAETVAAEPIAAGVQVQQVDPTLTTAVDPAVAAQIAVEKEATVRGQLESLFADIESGEVPPWARVAFNTATDQLNARGLQASSISAGAITLAMMQSALPIATADAQTYFGAALQNVTNRQQTELANLQVRQQNMLTDVAVQNASDQFNASSKQQTQQFIANLISSISTQNADRLTATSQFNANQKNVVEAQNARNAVQVSISQAQLQLDAEKFNSNVELNQSQFESKMQFAINQSNVLWRRTINTQNTAAQNAANQANTQNLFNISQVALNNLWSRASDNAAWVFEASENEKDKKFNVVMAAGNRDFYADGRKFEQAVAAGNTVFDILDRFDII